MEIVTIIFTSIFCIFFMQKDTKHNQLDFNNIEEIWVYDYFTGTPYRKGEIERIFQKLENEKKIALDANLVDFIKKELNHSSKAVKDKFCNSAVGKGVKQPSEIIFCSFLLSNKDEIKVVMYLNGISDYANCTSYIIHDDKKDLWRNCFYEILNRIK